MTFHHAYLPPHLAAQFARERVDLNGLRDFVAIEVDRLIDFLDTLDGDPDFEADHSEYRRQPDGSFATVGISSDDEPSLCGIGSHEHGGNWPGFPSGGNYGEDPIDLEAGDFDDETDSDAEPDVDAEPTLCGITVNALFATGSAMDADESEPSLGSLNGTVGCEASQLTWAGGGRDDREEENEHGGDIQDEPHDEDTDLEPDNEDKGAEEDEGPVGHLHRDRDTAAVARAVRLQLDGMVSRKQGRLSLSPGLRMVTVSGREAVIMSGRTVY